MSKNSLIIITGIPGTGKTSLGKKLADLEELKESALRKVFAGEM